MDTIDFPYVMNNVAHVLTLTVTEGRIVTRPIADLLGLQSTRAARQLTDAYGAQKVKVGRTYALAVTPDQLDLWLSKVTDPRQPLHQHIAQHLLPTIREKSADLRVTEHLRAIEQEKKAAAVLLVNPVADDGVSEFQRQATRGGSHNWLVPAMIEGAVARGRIDTYHIVEDIWEGGKQIAHVEMTVAKGVKIREFSAMHARGELLTGPEMQRLYPESPLLKRRMLDPYQYAEVSDATDTPHGRIVTVPAQLSKFSWEKDLEAVPQPKGARKC